MTLLPWCLAIPLLGSTVLLAGAKVLQRAYAAAFAIGIAAATAVLCALVLFAAGSSHVLTYWFGGWQPGNHVGLGIAFAVDGIGAALALLSCVVTLAVLLYSQRSFDEVGALWGVLVLAHLGATIAFAYTADLFDLLVFYELASVASFALAGYKVASRRAMRSALNFAVATSLGSFSILFALALLEGATGELNAAAIGEALGRAPGPALAAVAFALLASGFLVKAAVPPFHFWFVDAQTTAPAPTGALFDGALALLGVYALARTWTVSFARAGNGLEPVAIAHVFYALGCVGAVVAALLAFTALDLKRALGFTTVAQMAAFVAGIFAGSAAFAGTALAALAYSLVVVALALWLGELHRCLGSMRDGELRGRGGALPWSAVAGGLGILGLAGLPPVPAALGRAALDGPLLAASIFAAALCAGRFARAFWVVYLAPPPQPLTPARGSAGDLWFTVTPAVALGLAAFACGALPWAIAATAAIRFLDPTLMAGVLLHAHQAVVPHVPPAAPRAPSGVRVAATSLATAMLALGAAVAVPRLARHPLADRAHETHGGRTADYVTWLACGIAALTCVVLVVR